MDPEFEKWQDGDPLTGITLKPCDDQGMDKPWKERPITWEENYPRDWPIPVPQGPELPHLKERVDAADMNKAFYEEPAGDYEDFVKGYHGA